MKFIQIINNKKFTIINILLFSYIMLNLLDGERGLISYYQKKETKKELIHESNYLVNKLTLIERKNNLLTDKIDLDYLEILVRQKFMVGKTTETVYINQ
tara:strand:- start:163 stop:459 length:297 start_codon:yes stop_codon:yes gene_type:complete